MSYSGGDNWFHGKITRENAAHLVMSPGKPAGYFLVRESLRMPGSFVLTMWADNTIHHFQIVGHGDGWFSVDNGPLFQGLDKLIHHYQHKSDGLPQKLTGFVQGHPPPLSSRQRVLTSLHRAVASNDLNQVKRLVSGPSNLVDGSVDSPNSEGQTPVHEAAKRGYYDILKVLLDHRPDLSIRDTKGTTALHLAARNGHSNIIKLLVETGGADVQERNITTGWVALHEASFRGHIDCCVMLLSLNAPLRPRTPSPEEDTPKDLAVRYKQDKVMELLDWVALNYPRPRTNTMEWLFKNTDRNQAVELLRKRGLTEGSFLVRPNSRRPGFYALTLVHNQMPFHYEIVCESDRWFYIDDGPLFDSISACIDHYMMFADGLPTLLRYPVPPPHGMGTPNPTAKPSPGKLLLTHLPHHLGGTSDGGSHPVRPTVPIHQHPNRTNIAAPQQPHPHNGPTPPGGHSPTPGPRRNPRSQDNYQMVYIQENALTLKNELGNGEFGSVLKGIYRAPDGRVLDVAVKTLREESMGHGEREFLREAKIMVNLHHPCIVQLIGVTKKKPLMIIQELVPYGALVDYLYEGRYPKPNLSTLKLWAAEIASGMMYLEKKRFVHRDLAARNILVMSEKLVKISDFGLSRAVGANSDYYKASQGGRWPVKWYAPESINYGSFSHSSDVWSYGVTLWEMFSFGEPPYGEMTGAEVLDYIENRNGRLESPPGCPSNIYTLMLKCWSLDEGDRPTFAQLYKIFDEDDIPHRELYQSPGKL